MTSVNSNRCINFTFILFPFILFIQEYFEHGETDDVAVSVDKKTVV